MLKSTSPKIAECLEKAANARQNAHRALSKADIEFWLEQEAKWMRLADSYSLIERVTSFSGSRKRPPPDHA